MALGERRFTHRPDSPHPRVQALTGMSYNSFKRVLGETSLERKCRFLFGACLLFLIAGSFWWYGSRTESVVYDSRRNDGQRLVDAVMLQRHWMKMDVPLNSHEFADMPVSARK